MPKPPPSPEYSRFKVLGYHTLDTGHRAITTAPGQIVELTEKEARSFLISGLIERVK